MTSSLSGVIVLESNESEEKAMEPQVMPTTEVDETDEDLLVHSWRVEQLRAVGLTQLLAEIFADLVDWHEVATLVERAARRSSPWRSRSDHRASRARAVVVACNACSLRRPLPDRDRARELCGVLEVNSARTSRPRRAAHRV
jgi:hypothetical protein